MSKIDVGIYVLAGLSIAGVVALSIMEKDTAVIIPTMTALIGIIVGKNSNVIAGVFKKKRK